MKKDKAEDDIKVNRRSTDKVFFESSFIQSVSDKIDFFKEEILSDIDSHEFKRQLDDFDFDEFSGQAIERADDIVDDISKFKSEIISSDDLPEDVKRQYRNTQMFLNRDEDYIRRARKKMARLNSGEFIDVYKTNIRIIELCDKALAVRKENFDAYFIKGQALVNMERYSEAIDEFVNALSLKDDVEVWLAIGNANRLNGDFGDAIDVYDSVLKRNEKSVEAVKGIAFTCFDMGDYALCDEMFSKANSIEYLDEDSFKVWSECLEHLKDD
ncbi:tetratricopeptide repeat protein [Methanobrevibacter sp.]|uniref:tetratricopeptide repeat protein n=1 Tax=Methanobrevibacter sp. TaxID=66852 RepID=UPI0025CCB11E|nr:tetratricopeptide repeat protein [Methanobrevibacter sp.]MBQ2831101.1 tetratricopeptide repeat protein [Methanobrevibacter sp.]